MGNETKEGFVSIPVKIECPNCGKICDAAVIDTEGAPFADYTHQCEHCEYWITESEWEEIKDKHESMLKSGVQCQFEGRKITVGEFNYGSIFVLSVQNTPESCKPSYDMILSKEAFIGLLAMIDTFVKRENIDINKELHKFIGEDDKLDYTTK